MIRTPAGEMTIQERLEARDKENEVLGGGGITGPDPATGLARTIPGVAEPMPVPKEPTAAERARHMITHLPYRAWCPYCVGGRRPNTQHRRCRNESSLPVLHADYAVCGSAGSYSQCCTWVWS